MVANINGHLYMVNTLDDSWEDLVGSPNFSQDFNDSVYTSCPGHSIQTISPRMAWL